MLQPIPIIGAGIAGLTLSRSLLHRGIPTIIYEKSSSNPRFNYAITLHSTAYQPLLEVLNLDDVAFKKRVAVDAEDGGAGTIGEQVDLPSHGGLYATTSSFRANRAKLEHLLREGLDIRWKHSLQGVQRTQKGPRIRFSNGESWSSGKLVIGADGVHSDLRKLLLPASSHLNVLPYVVFNGKRRMEREEFDNMFRDVARPRETNVWEVKAGDVMLNVSVNKTTSEEVSLSWIYSRPVRSDEDALHRPNRPNEDAQKTPDELFQEIGELRSLKSPFSDIFDAKKMRGDRILHWLMRTTSTPLSDLQDLFARNGVCLMGDAIHAEPIVGGNGANAAILDALALAEAISSEEKRGWEGIEGNVKKGVSKWYDERYPEWEQGAVESQKAIARMHEVSLGADARL
ncbi:hypothetical protein AA0116_g9624 [Alternaria tenuissima]|jgi:tyrosinase|nr:hypothetical protein AA0116_g9624 [Alternaria tenuissima]